MMATAMPSSGITAVDAAAKGLKLERYASGGALLLRTYPSATATVAARIPNGAQVQVYGAWEGWYVVHYSGAVGYAAAAYVSL